MVRSSAKFEFRIFLAPDDHEVQIWCFELIPIEGSFRSKTEWVEEHFNEFLEADLYEKLELDKSKCWQVIGRGELVGEEDYEGGYDEDLYLREWETSEIPQDYFDPKVEELQEMFTLKESDEN